MENLKEDYNFIEKEHRYIARQLRELGFKRYSLGYFFLIIVEDILMNRRWKVNSFYKDIYPYVAKMFSRKAWTVERNIRHAIDRIWDSKKNFKAKELFSYKPRCRELAYAVKNYLLTLIS